MRLDSGQFCLTFFFFFFFLGILLSASANSSNSEPTKYIPQLRIIVLEPQSLEPVFPTCWQSKMRWPQTRPFLPMSLSSKWVCQLNSECKHMIHSSSTSDLWMMGLQTRGRWKPVRTHSYRVSGRLQTLAINYVATNLPKYSASGTKTQNQNPRCNNQRPSWYEKLSKAKSPMGHHKTNGAYFIHYQLNVSQVRCL